MSEGSDRGGPGVTVHDDFQRDIPAFLASRLDKEAGERLQSHVKDCALCAEALASWRIIAGAVHDHGDVLFRPHPPVLTLREHAMATGAREDEEMARHVASCSSCALEVVAWRDREASERSPRGVSESEERKSGRARFLPLTAALAMGLMVGLGLGALGSRLGLKEIPGTARPGSELHGPLPLWVLASPPRGEASPATFRAVGDQPFVLLAVRPALPPDVASGTRYLIEIRRAGGAIVWRTEIDMSQLRAHADSYEVVTFPVPVTAVPPGRYEFTFSALEPRPSAPLLEIPFEVERPM